jgi:hypothetical protein
MVNVCDVTDAHATEKLEIIMHKEIVGTDYKRDAMLFIKQCCITCVLH